MSYAITVWDKGSIGNRNIFVNALKRVRKAIFWNTDDHIIINYNLVDYDSIFEYLKFYRCETIQNSSSQQP